MFGIFSTSVIWGEKERMQEIIRMNGGDYLHRQSISGGIFSFGGDIQCIYGLLNQLSIWFMLSLEKLK